MRLKTAVIWEKRKNSLKRKFLEKKFFLKAKIFSDNNEHSHNSYGNGLPSPISADDFNNQRESSSTVFAPGISPEKDLAFGDTHHKILGQMDGNSVGLKPQRSEVVTTDFETNDDLQPSRTDRSTTSLPSSSKKGLLN